MFTRIIFLPALFAASVLPAGAWSGHHMLSRPVLEDLDIWERQDSVEAISLRHFLLETEEALAGFLQNQESWLRKHLPHYEPRPEELAFRTTGEPEDILLRFFHAVRMNPESKVPLYLQLLPGETAGERERLPASEVAFGEKMMIKMKTLPMSGLNRENGCIRSTCL